MPEEKIGRPRQYAFEPAEEFANPVAAHLVGALDELSERHFDLISDLPNEVLGWVPTPGWFSIVQITAHVIQGEGGWVARVTEGDVPTDISGPLEQWRNGGTVPDVDELAAMCRRVRQEITKHRVAPLRDIDRQVSDGLRVLSVRGILMHEVWHWTYHSGQTGLLRGLRGWDYRWTLDRQVAGHSHMGI